MKKVLITVVIFSIFMYINLNISKPGSFPDIFTIIAILITFLVSIRLDTKIKK